MSEEQNVSQESPQSQETSEAPKQTSDSTSKVTTEERPIAANPIANQSRQDIYGRFDKQFENADSSSEKEESQDGEDLKTEAPSSDTSTEQEVKSEKPTSVKKGKGKISEEPEKTVPLQALHEARDRFKKLNLEHREYKASTEKQIEELKEQLSSLSNKLATKPQEKVDVDLTESDIDPEKQRLLKRIQDLERKTQDSEVEQQKRAQEEAQVAAQKRLDKVDADLAKEGFKGFKAVLAQTEKRLLQLVTDGEITDNESKEPSMWKKVYKEDVYPEVKSFFIEQEKAKVREEKTSRKKKANLVDYPGSKGTNSLEETEDDKPVSFEDFNKQQMNEIMENQKKRFFSRQRK